jgi:2-isopropylmalate synthase
VIAEVLGRPDPLPPRPSPLAHITLGIHAHNDSETGVANTLEAVRHGCTQVQGTINGYGERCGNANLISIIPDLQLKMGYQCTEDEKLRELVELSRYVSELANLNPDTHQPFVGQSAFAHKGGTHVNAVVKYVMSYQHIDPALVGNETRVLVSELAGKDNIAVKRREFGLDGLTREEERKVLQQIKDLENAGFAFESAEASVDLMLRRARKDYHAAFELIDYTAAVEHRAGRGMFSEATVKVRVGDRVYHEVAEGNGPVNALNRALRKAIMPFYPRLKAVHLTDYKVRILDSTSGTAAMTRVLIDFSDGENVWSTVGASTNIIEASWIALSDSVEYFILTDGERHHVAMHVPELMAGDD